ncbi:hypothetical protein Q3G72_034034 [Acer saccharum]|nr:hypothetical protein Q3G72_034034 [Acer saccharum]
MPLHQGTPYYQNTPSTYTLSTYSRTTGKVVVKTLPVELIISQSPLTMTMSLHQGTPLSRSNFMILGKALGGGVILISAVLADKDVMLCIRLREHGRPQGTQGRTAKAKPTKTGRDHRETAQQNRTRKTKNKTRNRANKTSQKQNTKQKKQHESLQKIPNEIVPQLTCTSFGQRIRKRI